MESIVRRTGGSVGKIYRRWIIRYQKKVKDKMNAESGHAKNAQAANRANEKHAAEILASNLLGGSLPTEELEYCLKEAVETAEGTKALTEMLEGRWCDIVKVVPTNSEGRIAYREFNEAFKSYALCKP